MSGTISAIAGQASATTAVAVEETKKAAAAAAASKAAASSAGGAAGAAHIHKIAKEFETLLVHQLLEAAKVGGDGKDGGYKSMAVDAFATGVSQGGGLGLAKQIEDALSRGR
jgi:Rod binding domain-containing protein